jgi:hypothetical protein
MTTVANCWHISYADRERMIFKHVDHPGYIVVKADDEGFCADIMPDVGNEAMVSAWIPYSELEY